VRESQAGSRARRRSELRHGRARSAIGVTFLALQAWLIRRMRSGAGATLAACIDPPAAASNGTDGWRMPSRTCPARSPGVYRRNCAGRRSSPSWGGAGGALAAPDGAMGRRAVPRAMGPLASRGPTPVSRPPLAVLRHHSRRPRKHADPPLHGAPHWRFFETFVVPADHYLPPDNFQRIRSPSSRIARSPPISAPKKPLSTGSPRATSSGSAIPGHARHPPCF